MRLFLLIAVLICTNSTSAQAETPPTTNAWHAGLKQNGGGFFIASPDETVRLRFTGFFQLQSTYTDQDANSYRHFDMRIRRARIGFSADLGEDLNVYFEYDGAASSGTSLTNARIDYKIIQDNLKLRAGKFTSPFSHENFTSSRALPTVERYIAVSSMLGIPALDGQIGAMLWGDTGLSSSANLRYYLALFNGNADNGSTGTRRDDNQSKELVARIMYLVKDSKTHFGFSYDQNTAATANSLSLKSPDGTSVYVTGPAATGGRRGYLFDFNLDFDKFTLSSELLHVAFSDARTDLNGGFLQGTYWLKGSESDGLQLLLRAELAELDGASVAAIAGRRVNSFTLGANWFLNGNLRLQTNLIRQNLNGPGNADFVDDSSNLVGLIQLQAKM